MNMMKRMKKGGKQMKYHIGLAVLAVLCVMLSHSPKAMACATCSAFESALKSEFTQHQNWMNNEWWKQNVEKSMKSMTNESNSAVWFETITFGAFLDAQNSVASTRTIQESVADSLKNYTPSDTICRFGTLSRSLALSESKSKANQLILTKRSINRQLGQENGVSAEGEQMDRAGRLKQFQKDYCDSKDFGNAMSKLCIGSPSDARLNVDINYTRAVDTRNTLDVDFTDTNRTNDENDIMALANNLYAHNVFERIDARALTQSNNVDLQSTFLSQRAIVAKRSVAENTFNEIVGEKSAGSTGSKTYMLEALKYLGLSAADAEKYLGSNPSYDAQMEVLTKKLYQDPAFYANLMDSPANVNRQYAALQAFGLMQKRDIFETVSRSEMLMSLLLEMEIAKYQDNIQNRQNQQ